MVQLFYYENRGKTYKKLMSYEGLPFKVNLFPNEELGSTLTSYWIIKIPWWRKTTANILEVYGSHYRYASGRVTDLGGGTIEIKGRFKHSEDKSKIKSLLQYASSPSKDEKLSSLPSYDKISSRPSSPELEEFQMILTTNVSNDDFHQGYSMTGKLEQSARKGENMLLTHFAVVKRKGY